MRFRQIVAWTSLCVVLGLAAWWASPVAVTREPVAGPALSRQALAPKATTQAQPPGADEPTLRVDRVEERGRRTPGGAGGADSPNPGVFDGQAESLASAQVRRQPHEHRLQRAQSFDGDVRTLVQSGPVAKRERPEHEDPDSTPVMAPGFAQTGGAASQGISTPSVPAVNAPAPATTASFDGLDFATWGAGHPPDPNGDVGPNHYIQTINTSIGIYDKATTTRLAAFTFNAFMSQGNFGNLCDTDNYGDPVVLYDTFEDRWFITDFAFKLDKSGNVSPQHVYQCFAVSKTGDPVAGGWNYYSIETLGGLGDYPKFGVWTDGIYMSANMFDYSASGSFQNPRVWALNKAQMYAGAPSVQVVSFDAPAADFTLLPSNARLQTGTPPVGTPNYFVSTWQYLNALTVYKFHVDWNSIGLSTFTGPDAPAAATSWPNATVPNAPSSGGNSLDVLQIRAMVQNQYSNLGGVESLWAAHTVRRGNTSGFAAPRWYQVDVTGGTVAANLPQAATWDPDGANVIYRFMPSVAVDHAGDMAMGYSTSSSTTKPAVKYAGRLAADPINTLSQTEQLLIQGTGTQTGTCGSTCIRWGDYSAMTLDPDGCTFWYTNEYYAADGLNFLTRIGSFSFPSCTPAGAGGTLQGTVRTAASVPINGATVRLGSRTATTDSLGHYSFSGLPAGTYPTITASFAGFIPVTFSAIAVTDGGTTTQDFALSASTQIGCFIDTTQADFQAGVSTKCDLTTVPGSVTLVGGPALDQQNTTLGTSGVGFSTTTWGGQTFTPSVSGSLTKADINLFCSGCTGTTPNLTLSVRATSGGLPTGADLASATITGFSNGGAASYFTVTFGSPYSVTAGTQYALVLRPTANPSPGTYALTRSGTSTAGSSTYAGGTRVAGAVSGTVWSIPTTGGVTTDAGFRVYIDGGFATSGNFVSSTKDANPAAGGSPAWSTIAWTDTVPSNTTLQFQAAASNNPGGPFTFVGPDTTAATFFANGGSLTQFNGFRYLQYKAFLTSSNGTVSPTISDVTVCFGNVPPSAVATALAVNPASGLFGGVADLSATLTSAGSGVAGKSVSFSLNGTGVGSAVTDGSGVATVSSVSLVGIGAGSYPSGVAASFAGDASYLTSSGSNTLSVGMLNQTITFDPLIGKTWGDPDFAISATASSGLAVSFGATGNCTVTGSNVHILGAGSCTITASQAGNGNYNPAPSVPQGLSIAKASQSITFGPLGNKRFGDPDFGVSATATSGLAVTFGASGNCTVTGTTVHLTGTGTCTITASQAGNANYTAAPSVPQTFTIGSAKLNQTITFNALANKTFGNADFTVKATASSGLTVMFTASGNCTVTVATVHLTGAGSCTITASQAGNATYNAAPNVARTFTIAKANQTITFGTLANRKFGAADFMVSATASSGLAVSFAASGVCTVTGTTVHLTAKGTCTITASQAGDSNYNAAPNVARAFKVQ